MAVRGRGHTFGRAARQPGAPQTAGRDELRRQRLPKQGAHTWDEVRNVSRARSRQGERGRGGGNGAWDGRAAWACFFPGARARVQRLRGCGGWGSRAGCGRRYPVTAPCACAPLKSVSFTCERGWLGVKDAVLRQRFAVPSTIQTDHLRLSAAAETPAADPGQPEIWRADQLATPAGGRGPPGPRHIRRRRPSVDAMVMSTPAGRTLAAAPSLPEPSEAGLSRRERREPFFTIHASPHRIIATTGACTRAIGRGAGRPGRLAGFRPRQARA